MICFKKIEIRNFLTYGNSPVTFEFESGITRITGKNESGKSSIISDGLMYCLYGTPYRKIKLSQLINCYNKKDLQTTLWFDINKDSYRIERGMKENYFRIYKNEEIVPVPPSSKSYQKHLEEDILQMSSAVFEQLSMKSLTKEFSFFSLKKDEKREVIENILSTGVYSQMNKVAKIKADELQKEISDLQKDNSNLELLITQEEENLKRLETIKKIQEEESDKQMKRIRQEIDSFSEANNELWKQLDKLKRYKEKRNELNIMHSEKKRKNDSYTKQKIELESKISLIKTKVQFLKSTCGECPNIKKIIVDDNVNELLNEKKIIVSRLETLQSEIQDIQSKISICDSKLSTEQNIQSQINFNNKQLLLKENELKENNKQIIEVDTTKLESYKKKLTVQEDVYNEKCNLRKHYLYARQMLSDENIKAYVVKKYLPAINTLLNYYLQKFGSAVIFKFNSEFEEEICSKNKEGFSYESFSEGGKRKIDLSILFTFIEFLDCKFGDVNNVLILDEITGPVDAHNENVLFDILRELSEKKNKSINIISHSGNIDSDKVDRLYEVKLDNGFSQIKKLSL